MTGPERYPAVRGACRHRTDFELWQVAEWVGLPPAQPAAMVPGAPYWRGENGVLRLIATATSTPQAAAHLQKIADVDQASPDDWCRRFRWHVQTNSLWLSEAA